MFLNTLLTYSPLHTCLLQNALMRDGDWTYEESPIERASRGIMGGRHHRTLIGHAHSDFSLRIRRE